MTETITIDLAFTTEQLDKMKLQLVDTVTKHQRTEEAKKEADAEFNQYLKALKEEIHRLAGLITAGHDTQMVECEVTYGAGLMTYTNKATGEVVKTRPASADEMQGQLFGDE